ncbi:hypothetical protein K8R32_00360 [bacterium]|nr:hypothetical protein [bacterium]
MGKKQIILIGAIVVFGLGGYLTIMTMSNRFENSYCGKYKSHLQDQYYKECLETDKALSACENEAIDKAWEEIRGMEEEECEKNYIVSVAPFTNDDQ